MRSKLLRLDDLWSGRLGRSHKREMGAGIAASPHCAETWICRCSPVCVPLQEPAPRSLLTSSGVASAKSTVASSATLSPNPVLSPRRDRPVFGSAVARLVARSSEKACAFSPDWTSRVPVKGPLGGPRSFDHRNFASAVSGPAAPTFDPKVPCPASPSPRPGSRSDPLSRPGPGASRLSFRGPSWDDRSFRCPGLHPEGIMPGVRNGEDRLFRRLLPAMLRNFERLVPRSPRLPGDAVAIAIRTVAFPSPASGDRVFGPSRPPPRRALPDWASAPDHLQKMTPNPIRAKRFRQGGACG